MTKLPDGAALIWPASEVVGRISFLRRYLVCCRKNLLCRNCFQQFRQKRPVVTDAFDINLLIRVSGVRKALQAARAQGVKVVLTTGRPFNGVRDYLAALRIQGLDDFSITYNGALIQQVKDGAVLRQRFLSHASYCCVEALARQLNCHFHVLDRNISRYTLYASSLTKIPLVFCEADKRQTDVEWLKLMMIDNPEVIDQIQPQIPQAVYEEYSVIRRSPYFIEFMHKEVHKGNTVQYLAERLAITPDQVMAIGDQQNDGAMFQYAGLAVAMGHASEMVQAKAHYVTKSNADDGVADAIERRVLIRRRAGVALVFVGKSGLLCFTRFFAFIQNRGIPGL